LAFHTPAAKKGFKNIAKSGHSRQDRLRLTRILEKNFVVGIDQTAPTLNLDSAIRLLPLFYAFARRPLFSNPPKPINKPQMASELASGTDDMGVRLSRVDDSSSASSSLGDSSARIRKGLGRKQRRPTESSSRTLPAGQRQ
jgi:hypothetical protein